MRGVEEPGIAVVPEPVRVCICAPDDDLRAWLTEELALMTWVGNLELACVASLDGVVPELVDLFVLGIDGLDDIDLERLRARSWTVPIIAIGASPEAVTFDRVLTPALTSRQLKRAIRELVFDRR